MRFLPLISLLALNGAVAATLPLTVSVGSVCEVAAHSSQVVTLRCTAHTPAPLDPREYVGGQPGSWHLVQTQRGPEGALLYRYELVAASADLHFD